MLGIFITGVCRHPCAIDFCHTSNEISTFFSKSSKPHRFYKRYMGDTEHFCHTSNEIPTFFSKSLKTHRNYKRSMGDTEHFCHTSNEILTFSNLEAPNHRKYNILRHRGSWALFRTSSRTPSSKSAQFLS